MNAHTAAEIYLLDFHRRTVGSTSVAFGSIPASLNGTDYASSYHALASMIPTGDKVISVLDIGCGDGHLLGLLSKQEYPGLQLIGVDMSDGELDVARSTLPTEVSLLKERAQDLSIETGTVDVVFSHMALMLMDDIEQVLSEIHRVLRPFGTLAFIVGGKGILDPIRHLYLDELRPILREEGVSLRLGDARTKTEEGWRNLLSSSFTNYEVANVDLEIDSAPSDLWDSFFSTTYDVDLLSSGGKEKLHKRFLSALADNCDSNGKVHVGCGLWLITAQSI